MDRIKIELTFTRLKAINRALATLDYQVFASRAERARYNILHQVAAKMAKKQIDKYPDNGKAFSVKLEYHEAHELEDYMRFFLNWHQTDHLVQIVADQLHQKLA